MSVIAEKLSKKGFSMEYNDNVISGLIAEGIDSIKGARGLAQIRRDKIESQLAESIMDNPTPRGSIFQIDYEDSVFKFNVIKPSKKQDLIKEA
jgi:ATP-dependent Clp protease ATP-binding subunit ClpA